MNSTYLFTRIRRLYFLENCVCCVLFLLLSIQGFSMANDSIPVKQAITAARLCQEKNYEAARTVIDAAVLSPEESQDVYSWYIRGFIYKEIYKNQESDNRNSNARNEAVASFLQSKKYVNAQGSQYNNDAALKYLAATFYNDALRCASDFEHESDNGITQLKEYHNIMHAIEPGADITGSDIDFNSALGDRYYAKWMQTPCDKTLNKKAAEAFTEAKNRSSQNCDFIYNLALTHYNIRTFSQHDTLQCYSEEEGKDHLEIARSLLLEAEAICPDKVEIIAALLNLYRSENNFENVKLYQAKLSTIKDEGPINK